MGADGDLREDGPAPRPLSEHPLPPESPDPGPLALVMGGGGARAAYQVGFLRALARQHPELEIPIITGVSAGAINAVHLAAHLGNFSEAVEDLRTLWLSLTVDRVFRVDSRSLVVNLVRSAFQLISGGLAPGGAFRSLVDTEPLAQFLAQALHTSPDGVIPGIDEKMASGRLRALAISTSSYSTGQSVTWIQGDRVEEWERPQRRARRTRMTIPHVMASASLPLFFPAIQVGGEWYGDGGIRLAAPLSPALHLGAERILSISTRFDRMQREAERPMIHGYPPPAQVLGALMNSIFLDLLDQDAWRVETLNRLLTHLPDEARGDLRVVRLLTLRPSLDLGARAGRFELELPGLFRFLLRGLGTRETRSPDVLSFVMFQPGYLAYLMRLGEKDGEARMGEVEALLAGTPPGGEGELVEPTGPHFRTRRH